MKKREARLTAPAEDSDTRGPNPYRELFERSADANLIIEGDTFVDCNEATVRMLRYANKDELLQTHPSELSPEYQPDGRLSYEKANEIMELAFAKGSHRFEWWHKRADGEVFPVEVLLTAVTGDDKRTLHVGWREITERKRLEEQLRQAQKMEAVGKLAGGIAHDFNNILVAIMGYAELIQTDSADAGEVKENTEAIIKASEKAANLTAQLLAFSRKQDLVPRVVDLEETVEKLCSMITRVIGEDIEMIFRRTGDILPAKVDTGQIEQVILNVVANARDAMPEGGTLTIETAAVDEDDAPGVDLPPGRYVSLKFTDTGSGMNVEVVSRAFEPFFTTKEMGRGTGLGLASVYGIVKQSRGDVRLMSREGEGTTLEILLPWCTEPLTRDPAIDDASKPDHSTGEHILVVEDDDAVRRLIQRTLTAEGFVVRVARHGMEALEIFDLSNLGFDLVLTDVIMPRMNGPELVNRLRRRSPTLPALFMSGYTDDVLSRQGFNIETVHLLRKPFPPNRLLNQVRANLKNRA